MIIEKDICGNEEQGYRVAVYSNCYAKSLHFLAELVAALKNDYPELTDANIEITIYGPPRRSGMMAIEAHVDSVHPDYCIRDHLENTK